MSDHRAWIRAELGLLSVVLTVIGFLAIGSQAASSGPAFSWLHADGTVLRNDQGQTVQLTGFNSGTGIYNGQGNTRDACGSLWSDHSPPDAMAANLEAWGFNSVRLHISWANLEPTPPTRNADGTLTHNWNQRYLQALDGLVGNLAAHHVYLIPTLTQVALSTAFKKYDKVQCEGSGAPDWMFPKGANETYQLGWCEFLANQPENGSGERPQDGWAAALQEVAGRYANNPAVSAIDLINEPGSADMDKLCPNLYHISLSSHYLDPLYSLLGGAVRQVNKRAVLILEDSNFSETIGHRLDSRTGLSNIMYEWHTYPPDWPAGQPLMGQELAFSRSLNVPFWVGEFDAFDADNNLKSCLDQTPARVDCQDPNWRADLMAMMVYTRTNGISWSMQNYSGTWSIVIGNTDQPKPELLHILQSGLDTPPSSSPKAIPKTSPGSSRTAPPAKNPGSPSTSGTSSVTMPRGTANGPLANVKSHMWPWLALALALLICSSTATIVKLKSEHWLRR